MYTHTDTEGKPRKARVRNILKSSKKPNTIFNEHPVSPFCRVSIFYVWKCNSPMIPSVCLSVGGFFHSLFEFIRLDKLLQYLGHILTLSTDWRAVLVSRRRRRVAEHNSRRRRRRRMSLPARMSIPPPRPSAIQRRGRPPPVCWTTTAREVQHGSARPTVVTWRRGGGSLGAGLPPVDRHAAAERAGVVAAAVDRALRLLGL